MRRILGLSTRELAIAGGGVAALLCAVVTVTHLLIRSEVDHVRTMALQESPGDTISALLALARGPHRDASLRNRAVWTLGRIGDRRAIAGLESLLTAQPCDHEREVCQYEVRKALERCRRPSWRARIADAFRRVLPTEN